MPRTHTAGQLAAILAAERADFARVEIEDATGVYRDVSSDYGADFLDALEWGSGIDDAVEGGTVTLKREAYSAAGVLVSLAPLMTASSANQTGEGYGPAIDVGRGVRAWVTTVATGATPAVGDWIPVVDGILDDWDGGPDDVLVLPFRDRGAPLLDLPIDEEREYGDEEGTPLEDVMQGILEDNLTGVTLVVGASAPAFDVTPYLQAAEVSTLEALRTLALLPGSDVRYLWNGGADGVSELTLWTPPRSKTVADFTLGPDQYRRLPRVAAALENVRTQWTVEYIDDDGQPASYATPYDTSPYGYRPARIREDETSGISTAAEAQAMAEAALHDTESPALQQSMEVMGLLWMVQLGDLVACEPNGVHYDETQYLGVLRYRHRVAGGEGSTVLEGRAAIAGAYQRWIDLARLPGRRRLFGVPSPTIGPLYAEGSLPDDPEGDGAVWLPITFERRTESVWIYADAGEDSPRPAPAIDVNSLAVVLRRQEGDIASAKDWATFVCLDTVSGHFKKVLVFGVGYDGVQSLHTILEIQAVDAITPTLAAVEGLTITRVGNGNRVAWTSPAMTTPSAVAYPIWMFIRRNGFIIDRIAYAEGAQQWDDPNLDAGLETDYEVFAWCHGVSGPLEADLQPPPATGIRPVFVNDSPKRLKILWTTVTHIAWECTDPDAATIEVQAFVLIQGDSFLNAGQWVTLARTGDGRTNGTAAAGSWNGFQVQALTWRLRSLDAEGTVLAYSNIGVVH